ncbi:MAG: RagB/SusD family nutrient uptake outer membrane protein [Cytophagales bacterium]|nr:RagB/SusD family nutrient uptake outer membrane protein [Cytophagales bacterium]
MKIKISSIIIALLLFSCSEDFLDLAPEDSLSTSIFFKNQEDFEQAINGAYAPLRDLYNGEDGGDGRFGSWAMGEMRSDNTHYKYNPNFRAVLDGEFIADFLPDVANEGTEYKYIKNYKIISRANQILALIDDVEFDETIKGNIKGQSLFLRALAYFDLVQYFGEVPLHTTPVGNRDEAALPLSSIDEIYQQIITDVTSAVSLLPLKSSQEVGRATKGSAQMLLGNVYIVRKDWTGAETVLSDLIDSEEYSLVNDYENVFSIANKNNTESIFEVQYFEGTEGFGSDFIYAMLPMPLSSEQVASITGVAGSQAASTEGFNIPTPDIINSYESGDLRKVVSIDSIDVDGTYYPYIKKLLQPHSIVGVTGTNWPVYRYAEALLSYAEVLNENGSTGLAEGFLNQVRTRAGLDPINGLDQNTLREAIINERRVELAFENKRWLDLVRTDAVQEVMSAYGQRVKNNPAQYYYPEGFSPAPSSYSNFEELFPLPASEALLNPNF